MLTWWKWHQNDWQQDFLDEGLDYPLKRGQDNGNDNIMLRRVVQAPAVTEILKGLATKAVFLNIR